MKRKLNKRHIDILIDNIKQGNNKELESLLDDHKDLDIDYIQDDETKEGCFHHAALNNNLEFMQILVEYIKQQNKDNISAINDIIKKSISKKNQGGFTPLHFASYNGDLEMVKYLHSLGADILEKNNSGLMATHTAAQGDSPLILCYLKDLGCNLNQTDQQGRLPLHWACYQGMENSAIFLIKWLDKELINQKDEILKMTPLHLASFSGCPKIVKQLLYAGADKNITDKDDKTALEIAESNKFKYVQKILRQKPGFIEFLNLKQAYEKPRKKSRLMIMFTIYYIVCFLISIFVCVSIKDEFLFKVIGGINITLFVFSFGFLILVSKTHPGKIKKNENEKLFDILESCPDVEKVCPTCEVIKPPRSRHCEICQKCVSVYDHHCPWINNCVGANNYRFFYFFLLFIYLQILFQIFFNIYALLNSEEFDEKSGSLIEISNVIILIGCSVFLFPVSVLYVVQTNNAINGITNYERFSDKYNENRSKFIDDRKRKKSLRKMIKKQQNREEKQQKESEITQTSIQLMDLTSEEMTSSEDISQISQNSEVTKNENNEKTSSKKDHFELILNKSCCENFTDVLIRNRKNLEYTTYNTKQKKGNTIIRINS